MEYDVDVTEYDVNPVELRMEQVRGLLRNLVAGPSKISNAG